MSAPSTYMDLSDEESGGGHQINMWWSDTQPDRIHLVLTDPRLLDEHGEKPGLRLVLSANPKSADYSPANFNRCARLLRDSNLPAPAQDAYEHPRHLRYRDKVLELVTSAPPAGPLDPPAQSVGGSATTEAEVCDTCWCLVADLDKHTEAVHAK